MGWSLSYSYRTPIMRLACLIAIRRGGTSIHSWDIRKAKQELRRAGVVT